jgi:phosphate transport system substrate-binding protein
MEYAAEFVSEDASGQFGYLVEKGLIPLPADAHQDNAERVMSQTTLTAEAF